MCYIKIWIHAVWATKRREPVLVPSVLSQVCSHIRQNATKKGIFLDNINGHDDHMHVLMMLKNDYSISKQMQLIKGESAFWINENKIIKSNFEWADKFFAASVSDDKIEKVRFYIMNQQQHHKKQTFNEEYNKFLKNLGYDEDFG